MTIFTSFVAVGFVCATASVIYDMTKFTPGHITSLFVIIGSFLAIFGLYDTLIEKFGYGLSLPIISFGNNLVNAAYDSYREVGLFGILSGMFTKTSAGISAVIISSFLMSLFCKPKD